MPKRGHTEEQIVAALTAQEGATRRKGSGRPVENGYVESFTDGFGTNASTQKYSSPWLTPERNSTPGATIAIVTVLTSALADRTRAEFAAQFQPTKKPRSALSI